ncbi:MAG: hypothetical protein KI791_15915 [Cyclobacteriaceae bacterium]|nr:hypothetical protein [Cyclobacteriaceae bacterium SS2]
MLRSLHTFFIAVLFLSSAFAQNIIIRDGDFKQQDNGDIYLRMVIEQKNSPRERYFVKLFGSFNGGNFQQLSVNRSDVAPGEPVIFTLTPSDLGGTGSQLQLKVEIEATTFPLVVRGDSKVKKGKNLVASWTGYNSSGPYRVELIDDMDRAITLAEENGTSINRALDKDIEKGSYTLRVTPRNREAYGEMAVKVAGGVNPLFIIAPVALGGGAAALILLKPEEEGLPDPPSVDEIGQ